MDHNRIITGDLIITEFLQGFRSEKDFRAAKEIMESLEYHDFVGKKVALQSAQNFRILGFFDGGKLIVLTNGFELLHNDRDYDPMEELLGLQVRR